MDDNFRRLTSVVINRHVKAARAPFSSHVPAAHSIYLSSALLKRLAADAEFSPSSPDTLELRLRLATERHDGDAATRKVKRDGLQARLKELSEQADSHAATLEQAGPYVTLPVVMEERARLDALHFMIGRVELALEAVPADAAPASLEALKAGALRWRERLQAERARIRRDAESLSFVSPEDDPDARPLLDDLDVVTVALRDVDGCLEILRRRTAPSFTDDHPSPKKPDYTGSVKPSPFAAWRDSQR
jgi:hypothetical protein